MRPDFTIARKHEVDGRIVLTIDTGKSAYQGKKWSSLSNFQKRKFENLVFLTNAKDRPKIIYH